MVKCHEQSELLNVLTNSTVAHMFKITMLKLKHPARRGLRQPIIDRVVVFIVTNERRQVAVNSRERFHFLLWFGACRIPTCTSITRWSQIVIVICFDHLNNNGLAQTIHHCSNFQQTVGVVVQEEVSQSQFKLRP